MAKQESNNTAFPASLVEEATRIVQAAGTDHLASVESLRLAVEERVLRAALETSGWSLNAAAKALGKPEASAIARAIKRHPALAAEWRDKGPKAFGGPER